ncbi:MAG: hypothetical protein ACLKAO_12595, partial [Alkaliphilus sp.]
MLEEIPNEVLGKTVDSHKVMLSDEDFFDREETNIKKNLVDSGIIILDSLIILDKYSPDNLNVFIIEKKKWILYWQQAANEILLNNNINPIMLNHMLNSLYLSLRMSKKAILISRKLQKKFLKQRRILVLEGKIQGEYVMISTQKIKAENMSCVPIIYKLCRMAKIMETVNREIVWRSDNS